MSICDERAFGITSIQEAGMLKYGRYRVLRHNLAVYALKRALS